MPRKKKPKLDDVIDKAGLVPASEIPEPRLEAPPPEREFVQPAPDQARPRPPHGHNGTDRGFAERLTRRPTAPRKREPGEPAASFASKELRVTKMDDSWQVESRRDLTGNEKDKLAASGFIPVDDDEKIWNGSAKELRDRGTDINIVAYELSGKVERGGRGR